MNVVSGIIRILVVNLAYYGKRLVKCYVIESFMKNVMFEFKVILQ